MKRTQNIVIILIISILFLSCEDTSPSLGLVKHMILLDYSENTQLPTERLAVYVELKSDPIRIYNFNIQSVESGYVWYVDDPIYFEDKTSQVSWIGSSSFVSSVQFNLPRGEYILSYTDLAQRNVQLRFTVEHDDLEYPVNKNDFINEYMAVYDNNNTMIHYSIKSEFSTNEEVVEALPTASYIRNVLISDDASIAIVEPVITLNEGE